MCEECAQRRGWPGPLAYIPISQSNTTLSNSFNLLDEVKGSSDLARWQISLMRNSGFAQKV